MNEFFFSDVSKYFGHSSIECDVIKKLNSRYINISNKELSSWIDIHISYLSCGEKIRLAIYLFEEMGEFEDAIAYLESALKESSNPEEEYLSNLTLGIIYFSYTKSSPKERQRKMFRIVHYYFKNAIDLCPWCELAPLYLALVSICENQLEDALKQLCSASKSSSNKLGLYKVLSCGFKSLDMEEVAYFYYRRYVNLRFKEI